MVAGPDLPASRASSRNMNGDAIFLPDPSVAGDAILIQDGADIAAELNMILRRPMVEGANKWPNCECAYSENTEGGGFRPGKTECRRFGPRRSNQYRGGSTITHFILCQTGLVEDERPDLIASRCDHVLVTIQHVGLRRIGNIPRCAYSIGVPRWPRRGHQVSPIARKEQPARGGQACLRRRLAV